GRGLDRPESPGPSLIVSASPAARPPGPARLATVEVRRNGGSPASRIKSLSRLDYVLARRQARAAGADEAVQLNTDGHGAGGAAANLFGLGAGRLLTPALECGVLDGVVRGQVLAAARALGAAVEEGAFGPERLARAEA